MATEVIDYSSLQLRVIEEANRDDLATLMPAFIYEAEAEMWQDLRLRIMQRRYESQTPDTGRYMPLPDRYLDMYRVFVDTGGRLVRLKASTPAEIIEHYQPGGSFPRYFAITGLELEFERAPGSNIPIEMTFYQAPYSLGYQAGTDELGVSPPKISPQFLDDNNIVISNAVLSVLPHIYLYATMIRVGLYTHDEELRNKYSNEYSVAVKKANNNAKAGRITGGPLSPFNRTGTP